MPQLPLLQSAHQRACRDLIAERDVNSGVWVGRLSDSALSTATAVSALAMVDRQRAGEPQFTERIDDAVRQLADWQNDDGGWGDTDRSFSNLATTMLVRAAFHLAFKEPPAVQGDSAKLNLTPTTTGRDSLTVEGKYADIMRRAEAYIQQEGDIPGLRRRFGKDKTFAIPILTNCALAELVDWSEVASLPFELACLPFDRLKWLRLPVVSYAIPALVAIGQAIYHHRKPRNPMARWLRRKAIKPSLRVLQRMQPDSGGFLEATPLTSFVVMSLAAIGQVDHPVVQRGVEFLCHSQRDNAAWPIDEDLSTWVTTLSLNALPLDGLFETKNDFEKLVHTLLDRQQTEIHPFTDAAPGGWGWTGLSGAVPDVDDTAGALLALHQLRTLGHEKGWLNTNDELDGHVIAAARAGIDWLRSVQNRDGGWPTFCKGWGTMPFDRSTVDLTAHVLRALKVWSPSFPQQNQNGRAKLLLSRFLCLSALREPRPPVKLAIDAGFTYLQKTQQADGSWSPLWFGNQHHASEANPIFGTARVLLAYRDYKKASTAEAQRAAEWLVSQQNSDGGWGGNLTDRSSVEETAAVLSALLGGWTRGECQDSIKVGLDWLIAAVESDTYRHAAPIGLYFSRLWYYEKLYPLIFAASALKAAVEETLETEKP